ncbi:MAG TPA: methyltransferase domain-containing protein [Terracidiphilus sp.]|nr:methyltransferase domain-containing protein [Terracidiphilus sp.]
MDPPSPDQIAAARRFYAEDLRFKTRMSSSALFEAFASVPRERFVGAGPWLIQSWGEHWTTEEADPRHVYHDTLIALDETRHINNGQPSLWAYYFDRLDVRPGQHVLHLGCGTGYYTAILGEQVGSRGKVVAVEIEPNLAERARVALAPWPQVMVLCQDGSRGPFEPADFIVASAGATCPMPAWLAAVKPDGKLLFPLTATEGAGIMALLTRISEESFAARLHGGVSFIGFQGASDPEIGSRVAQLLRRDRSNEVRSLRLDAHDKDDSCWLHEEGWCFSRREPVLAESAA